MESVYLEPNLKEEKRKWFKNVKLIGEIDKGTSIYIEDYAYTYLHQCANYDLSYELSAALIGEKKKELNQILIYGIVLLEREEKVDNYRWVSKEGINKIQKRIEEYFPDGECVGWMHTQPGYGLMATTREASVHKEVFQEDGLLMLIDPVYNLESFYELKNVMFEEKDGFCIYYEKNENMQRYMEKYPLEVKEEEIDDSVVGEFRRLGIERKNKIKREKRIGRFIASMITVSLLITIFLLASYSLDNQVEEVMADNPINSVSIPVEIEEEKEGDVNEDKDEEDKNKEDTREVDYNVHVVKMGDSLLKISYNYYDTVTRAKEIAKFNSIEDYNKIYIGQELKLPK